MTSPAIPVLVALLAFAPALAAQDTVKLRNGTVEQGRIEAENYDALQFKAKKGKDERSLKLAWSDVAEVSYGDRDLNAAMTTLSSGNVGGALPKLQAIVANGSFRKELKPAAMLQLATAQQRMGKYEDASATLSALLKEHPKSRFLLPAARALVDCHLVRGDIGGGSAAIEAAASAAAEGGVDSSHTLAFDLFRGLLLEAKKDLVGAKVKYQAVANARTIPPAMTTLARLGIARCEQTAGALDKAKTDYLALLEQGVGNEVLAGAWNGLADIAMKDAAKSPEKLNDALLMYLRGVVEFGPAPGEGTGEYERALAGAGEVFKQLAEAETDETLKKTHMARSRQRIEQLRKEFPNSAHLPKQ